MFATRSLTGSAADRIGPAPSAPDCATAGAADHDPPDVATRLAAAYPLLGPRLYRYLHRRTETDEDAADLLSDTMVAILSGRQPFADVETWAFGIARNLVNSYWRRRGRRPAAVTLTSEIDRLDDGAPALPSPDDLLIRRAVDGLPPAECEVIELRYWTDLPTGTIAEILGIEPATCRQRLHRALTHLRERCSALRPDDEHNRPPTPISSGTPSDYSDAMPTKENLE